MRISYEECERRHSMSVRINWFFIFHLLLLQLTISWTSFFSTFVPTARIICWWWWRVRKHENGSWGFFQRDNTSLASSQVMYNLFKLRFFCFHLFLNVWIKDENVFQFDSRHFSTIRISITHPIRWNNLICKDFHFSNPNSKEFSSYSNLFLFSTSSSSFLNI